MNLIEKARIHAKEIPRLYNGINIYYSVSKRSFDRVYKAFLNQKKLVKVIYPIQSKMDEAYQDSIQALNIAMKSLEKEVEEEKGKRDRQNVRFPDLHSRMKWYKICI